MLTNHDHTRVLTSRNFLASYYPGRGQATHPLAAFPTVPPTTYQDIDNANGDDSGVESEDGWFDDGHLAGLAGGSAHISGALANEVCRRRLL